MSKFSDKLLNIYFFLFFWIWFTIVWVCIIFFRITFFKFFKKQIKKIFSTKGKTSVYYLEVFGPESAGNKYRTHKWVEILKENNFTAKSSYVYEYREYLELTSNKYSMPFFLMGFIWFRFWQIFRSALFDIIIVRRELLQFNDYGNLFFEKLLYSIHDVRILDFDDDISAAKNEPRQISIYGKMLLESKRKFSASIKYYTAFLPGSRYLKEMLLQLNSEINNENILVLPTCVDYEKFPPKNYSKIKEQITIGWIGAKGNLKSLKEIIPALNNLIKKHNFKLLIISDSPIYTKTDFTLEFIPWNQNYEIEQIHLLDIGVMPLGNSKTQKGKCGFKLIQYMGCGVVSLATALSANNDIINDGENGFLVPPEADWEKQLEKVLNLKGQYQNIGQKAFIKIKENYSFKSQTSKFLDFLIKQKAN